MPITTEAELAELILNGKVGAISLDTSIFDRYQCNFKSPTLSALKQFRDNSVKILISEIVAREVKSHLDRDCSKSQRELSAAIVSHARRWHLDENMTNPYLLTQDPAEFAGDQLDEFIATIDAEIVLAVRSSDTAKAVMERYFTTEPPFEANEKKKNEFPDAFALVSLEDWARKFDTTILCVSTDKGWQDFAQLSSYLICVDKIDVVLDKFNGLGRAVATKVVDLLRFNEAPKVWDKIQTAFNYRLSIGDFDVSVEDSPTSYEFEQLSAVLKKIDWSMAAPNVLDEDEETVTFSVSIKASIEFTVQFEFYIQDGIDKDDIPIANNILSSTRWVPFDLAVTVWRDMSTEVEAAEVSADTKGMTALFQRIDPFSSYGESHTAYIGNADLF